MGPLLRDVFFIPERADSLPPCGAPGLPEQGRLLPPVIGTQSSAGAARGGRGAAQRGRGRDK